MNKTEHKGWVLEPILCALLLNNYIISVYAYKIYFFVKNSEIFHLFRHIYTRAKKLEYIKRKVKRMKKVRKIIAILLMVLTLMSVISAATPVLAVEVTELTESAEETSETLNTEEAEEQTTSDEPEILNEMVEWRTESTKYFRNSDGSYTAAQYAYPIHYKENGEWKEIDNTLTEKSISGAEKGFVAENTNTPAIFPEELNQDSNNEISVTAENHTIRFSPKKNQKEFKVSDGKIKDREELNSVKIVESVKEKQEFSIFKVSKKAEKPEIKDNKRKEKFKVENKSGAIVYENVFKNVDFEYELNNSRLKESIVLNEKQDSYVFSFNMDFDGLFPALCEDGAINLCSDRAGENPIAKIEAPYMVDSNGEYSDAVTMSIKENGEEYILTVTADENWLNDTKRAYPVVIDPTINLNISRLNVIDNYIDNSTLEASESHPYAYHIYAGHSSLGKTRAYVKFNLPDLPDDNCIITNAFIVYYQSSVDKGSTDGYLTIHEVTENWNNKDASLLPTWNKQPKFDDKVLDYAKIEYNEGNEARAYQFDVTRTIKEWYETDKLETNNGFLLKSLDESKINRVQLYSAENSAEGAYPAIYVEFRNNKGLESYWDYSSFGVGVAGTAHVNDYTGNLVYELPIASSISEIMPIDIVAYYNNYCARKTGDGSVSCSQKS